MPGLWRWSARHPEWHPGRFGASVASFAVRAEPGHATLIDPILPPEPEAVWELVDELAADRLTIAFGDAIVTTPAGELRLWATDRVDQDRARWYRERFSPTLEPLVSLAPDHVRVIHGEPVIGRGAAALELAVASEP